MAYGFFNAGEQPDSDRRRQLALSLTRQGAPRNLSEGISGGLNTVLAALLERKAMKDDKAQSAQNQQVIQQLIDRYSGGGAPSGAAPDPASYMQGQPQAPQQQDDDPASLVYAKLAEAGIPSHVSAGLLGNIQQESNFRTDAVGDGGNSFGMGQWNGPRKEALMKFAQERGGSPTDISLQTDFLLHELKGSEAPAMEAIMSASTPEDAARVASEKFWRPGVPMNENRMQYAAELAKRFGGGQQPQQPPMQVAQAGGMDPTLLLLAAGNDPAKFAQLMLEQQQAGRIDPMEAQRLQMEQQRFGHTQQTDAQRIAMERERVELARRRLEADLNRGGEGFKLASPEEAQKYGAPAGQFGPDGRFYPINPPSGMTVESDGQGGIRVVQGPGAMQGKPFTEAQSKDNVYATRAEGALQTLDELAPALAGLGDRALDKDPTGVVRGKFQSQEYQVAQAAGNEFLQAILRKDTGAAITEPEQVLYGRTYLPQPGDGPEVLAYKQAARRRAVDAINSGRSPAQIIASEVALAKREGFTFGDQTPKPDASGLPQAAIESGIDAETWKYLTPEERKLWQ